MYIYIERERNHRDSALLLSLQVERAKTYFNINRKQVKLRVDTFLPRSFQCEYLLQL